MIRHTAETCPGRPCSTECDHVEFEGRIHEHESEKKSFRVGYFVWVDVEAFNDSEAGLVGEAALGWPGDWSPPHDPIPHEGVLNGYKVKASIIRSRAMMAKPND